MKITLISTSTYPSDQGIRSISSYLKKYNYKVNIIFLQYTEDYSKFYTKNILKQIYKLCKDSDIIGISSYASTAPRASQVIKYLRPRLHETVPIIYGGIHATIAPESCLEDTPIVVVGEAEQAFLEVIQNIEKNKDILQIPNVYLKRENKIIKNPSRPLIENLDSLPYADYDIMDHYILDRNKIRKFRESDLNGYIFFLTGRGCPYGCTYCSNNLLNEMYKGKGKVVRWHSPSYIIDNILFLTKKYKTLKIFDIRDDTFALRPLPQIQEFCNLYKKKVGLRFKCLADPMTVTEEKIKLLVEAGCTDIIVGIQGSERTNLQVYKRMQKDANVLQTAKILNKYKDKLAVMYDVITCNPYESASDVLSLINLLRKLPKPYYLSVNNLVFFTGTELYHKSLKDKIPNTSNLNYWDRWKHIKLKPRNAYLVLILNLMRGVVTSKRYGLIPSSLLNILLNKKMIRFNLKNKAFIYLIGNLVGIYDNFRENIAKPVYRSLPLNFKVWYDKFRYRV